MAATAHLLRTCLSRKGPNANQQNALNVQTQMEPVENPEKLKKQIQAVYDRIVAGGRITE